MKIEIETPNNSEEEGLAIMRQIMLIDGGAYPFIIVSYTFDKQEQRKSVETDSH